MERRLGSTTYDCVVIGAGVRLPPKNLFLFEIIVNTVHKTAPNVVQCNNSWRAIVQCTITSHMYPHTQHPRSGGVREVSDVRRSKV